MKKISIFFGSILLIFSIGIILYVSKALFFKDDNNQVEKDDSDSLEESETNPEYIKDKIDLIVVDDNDTYEFLYNDMTFKVIYVPDTWKIYDSYKITNRNDMKMICQALIDIHPIHGSDMISYRTSDDMVYEWVQHNIAYKLLPSDNAWRNSAKDVDFDPRDQGKSMKEIYEDRTGKKLDF